MLTDCFFFCRPVREDLGCTRDCTIRESLVSTRDCGFTKGPARVLGTSNRDLSDEASGDLDCTLPVDFADLRRRFIRRGLGPSSLWGPNGLKTTKEASGKRFFFFFN